MPPAIRNPTPEEFQEFRRRVMRDAAPQIARCTVPLYSLHHSQVVLNGTGTLFRIGGRHFVLSAGHVLDYAGIHNVPYCVPSSDQGQPVPLRILKVVTSPLPPEEDEYDMDVRDKDPFDIGVAELDQATADKLVPYWRFAQLLEIDISSPAEQACYYVLGFPLRMTTSDPVARASETKALSYTTALYEGQRDARDNAAELLLEYPEENRDMAGQISIVPSPKGISGCGIWRVTDPRKLMNDWKPGDVRLVGVEHRWRKAERYLVGTAIRHAIRLIYGRYEDLHPAMDLLYGQRNLIIPGNPGTTGRWRDS